MPPTDWFDFLIRNPALLPESTRAERGGDTLVAILEQYQLTERCTAEELLEQQRQLLVGLARHCAGQSPNFAVRLRAARLKPEQLARPAAFSRLPPLTRQQWIKAGQNLYCKQTPREHGNLGHSSTSGSTGEPVTVRTTQLCGQHWLAYTLREHLWHARDSRGRLAVIRANTPGAIHSGDWGAPISSVLASGTAEARPATDSVDSLVEWLCDYQPQEIYCLPSVLAAIIRRLEEIGKKLPDLRIVRTLGETLTDGLRDHVRAFFGLEIADCYSSQECGAIATQCPEHGSYHVSETILLEILRPDGSPCAVGEIGRVVITDLINFATPVIRYEIGDHAEAGPVCPCGRSSPTVKRFLGRERNLVVLPDGSQHWPTVGFQRWGDLHPIHQFQFIQKDRQTIIARFYVSEMPQSDLEQRMTPIIRAALGYDFTVLYEWSQQPLERGKSGKFEDFVSYAS